MLLSSNLPLKMLPIPQAAATPGPSAVPASQGRQEMQIVDGKFTDYRWTNGSWQLDCEAFKGKDGKVNWDLVRMI